MAKGLNKVMVIGNAGKDCEMRYTPSGKAVASLSLASNRQWKNAAGEKQERTEWFNCEAWDKLAEIMNQYIKKGNLVYVEGRLQTDVVDQTDGSKKYYTKLVVEEMILLGGNAVAVEQTAAPVDQDIVF